MNKDRSCRPKRNRIESRVQKSRPAGERSTFLVCRVLFIALGMMILGSGNVKLSHADSQGQTGDVPAGEQTAACESLLGAANSGDMNAVQAAIAQGADVNVADRDGRTALMFASYNGHTDIAELLLDRGARIDDRDSFGRTALIYAASGPYRQTVQLLLSHKADPNVVDTQEGWTALMFAASEGQAGVVEVLLNHGADKTLKDADGETALDFARSNRHADVVLLLK